MRIDTFSSDVCGKGCKQKKPQQLIYQHDGEEKIVNISHARVILL